VQLYKIWHNGQKTNINFNLARVKQSSNLSRFGDFMHSKLSSTEAINEVLFTHEAIILLQASAHHVCFFTSMQLNQFLEGNAEVGKSFCTKTLQKLCIGGTYQDLAYMTEKGMAGGGNRNKGMIDILEECPPSLIGAEGAGKPGAKTSNTEAESFLKKRLTSGTFSFRSKRVVNGEHITEIIEVDCNNVTIIATNADLKDVSEPVKSRFNILQFTQKTRDDGRSMNTFAGTTNSVHKNQIHEAYLIRCRRDQYLCCLIGHCVSSGIFASGINTTAAQNIFRAVLTKAGEELLPDTTNSRHFERLIALTKVLVMWDAIDQYFDSEFSPMINERWEPHMILGIEKLLVSRTEHAVMALGLLEHQWENQASRILLQHLKTKTLAYETPEQLQLLREQRSCLDVTGKKVSRTYLSIPLLERPYQRITPWYREQQLIDSIKPYMSICPSDSDLHVAIRLLSKQQLEIYDIRNDHLTAEEIQGQADGMLPIPLYPTIRTQGIEFTPTEVRIAYPLIANHHGNVIKTCIEKVLNYRGVNSQCMLYGRTLPGKGYIWETIQTQSIPETSYELEIWEATYHDEAVIAASRNACNYIQENARLQIAKAREQGVEPSYLIEPPDELFNLDFKSAFAGHPCSILDKSIDEYASMEHNRNIGISDYDLITQPVNDSIQYQQAVLASHQQQLQLRTPGFQPLFEYPKCFTRPKYHEERAQIRRLAALHPELYYVSAKQKAASYQPIHLTRHWNQIQEEEKENIPPSSYQQISTPRVSSSQILTTRGETTSLQHRTQPTRARSIIPMIDPHTLQSDMSDIDEDDYDEEDDVLSQLVTEELDAGGY
jgi:hypothetical protein